MAHNNGSNKPLATTVPTAAQERYDRRLRDITNVIDRMCFLHRTDVPNNGSLTDTQRVRTLKRDVIKQLKGTL